jgi:hypothetical protein
MNKVARLLKKLTYTAAATVVTLTSVLALLPQGASAAAQVQTRSIKMSNSTNSASTATTTYTVTATVATTSASMKGVVLDFCANSPIVGDSCTAPTGFTISGSPSVTTGGVLTASGWTAASTLGVNTLHLSNATGVATTGGSSVITFDITNVQNPTSAVGTFYARIYTYNATAGATGFTSHTNPDVGAVHVDDGGFAMSTANQVTITAKVQETLLFCVYTSGANCAGGTVAGMVLGDAFGVLSSTTTNYLTSTNATTPLTAKLGVASNATTGVTVRAKASGTLTSGANTIASTGNTCTADSAAAGTDQFGLFITAGAGQTDVSYGTVAGCSSSIHAFNTSNLTSTYGDSVLTTPGPTTEAAATIDFMGKAKTTTKSGVYTSTFTFIATGIY